MFAIQVIHLSSSWCCPAQFDSKWASAKMSMVTSSSDPTRREGQGHPPCKAPKPAEVLAKGERNLEWVGEERNRISCGLENICRIGAVGCFINLLHTIFLRKRNTPESWRSLFENLPYKARVSEQQRG